MVRSRHGIGRFLRTYEMPSIQVSLEGKRLLGNSNIVRDSLSRFQMDHFHCKNGTRGCTTLSGQMKYVGRPKREVVIVIDPSRELLFIHVLKKYSQSKNRITFLLLIFHINSTKSNPAFWHRKILRGFHRLKRRCDCITIIINDSSRRNELSSKTRVGRKSLWN